MMINNVAIAPCKIEFEYPWDKGIVYEVSGLRVTRIIFEDDDPTVVELMEANAPRPRSPVVQCVSVSVDRLDDFRFKETSIHIPMV